MAISYKSQGAGAGTETNGASLDLVCPAVVDANDILIAHVIHTGTTTAPTTPSGWTLLRGPENIGTTATGRAWVFGKLAAGTEDGSTVGFGTAGGTNGRAGRIYSFGGWESGTLADVVPAASFSSISHATDPQGPSVTTTIAGALAVALTCQDDNNSEEAIAGMSGGTWGGFVTYVNANWGPQGVHLDIQVATPTGNPGTISGGAMVAANDEANTIGFEIRPSVPLEQHSGSATLTGGGTIVSTGQKSASISSVLTGGGTVVVGSSRASSGAYVLTGGGTLEVTYAIGGFDRSGSAVLTGGGTLVVTGTRSSSGSAVLTGGGTLVQTGAKTAHGVIQLGGGGTLVPLATTARSVALILTGGGIVIVSGEGPPAEAPAYKKPKYKWRLSTFYA